MPFIKIPGQQSILDGYSVKDVYFFPRFFLAGRLYDLPYRRIYYASLDYYATFGKFEYNATFLPLKSTFWAKIRLQRQFLGKKFEYNVT